MPSTPVAPAPEALDAFALRDKSKPIHVRPTLFIGLGGTGFEVLCRLKRRVRALYGPYAPIRFLVLDTDPPDLTKSVLEPDEFVNLSGFDASNILKNLDQYKCVRPWWPEALKVGNVFRGAKQKRAVGRLAFYFKYAEEVHPKLQRQVSSLFQMVDHADEAKLKSAGLRILPGVGSAYVVSSLCGGTGSGCFLDVGFEVRNMMERLGGGRAFKVAGVFTLPEGYLLEMTQEFQRQRIQANAYACLRELDHFLDPAHLAGLKVQFTSAHPGFKPLMPPYGEVALVDVLNRNHERLRSIGDLYEMIAAKLFLDLSIGKARESREDNLEDVAGQKIRGRLRAYASFAVGALTFPARAIISHCTSRLAAELLELLLAKGGGGDRSSLVGRVKKFKAENELEEHEADMVLDRLRGAARGVTDELGFEPTDAAKAATELEKRGARLAERLAEAQAKMKARNREVSQKALDALDGEIKKMLGNEADCGMDFILAFLRQLDLSCQGLIEELQKELRALQPESFEAAARDAGRKVREAEKSFLLRARNVAAAYGEWARLAREHASKACEYQVRELAIVVFHQLRRRIGDWTNRLTKVRNKLEQALYLVGEEAKRALAPAEAGLGSGYVLEEEVLDRSAAEAIYAAHRPRSLTPVLTKIIEANHGLLAFEEYVDREIVDKGILPHVGEPFAPVARLNLFEAVERFGKPGAAAERLKSVVDRCAPFASIEEAAMGDMGRPVKQLFLGVDDRDDPKYQELFQQLGRTADLVSTGDRSQILVLAGEQGLPAFVFSAFKNYQYHYDLFCERVKTEGMSEFPHLDKAWAAPEAMASLFPE
ncbi:MAG: hypothetical protein HYZ53_25295 [Planctomycetes bacterium]|nr:hypothetical protein [Planctomycetota bacterium]